MSCRVALLKLHREGHLSLPEPGDRTSSAPVKDVYVYPLQRNGRKELCAEPPKPIRSPSGEAGLAQDWAEQELGEVDLGDRRLNKRLVTIAQAFYARPQANIPQACQTREETKATYRFFDHPETSMEKVLAPHMESTLDRISREEIVLAVQDTTSLNYTAHSATQNLGPIGYRLDRGIGLMFHSTLAFNRQGTPLGLLDVQCWARDAKDFGKKKRRTVFFEEAEWKALVAHITRNPNPSDHPPTLREAMRMVASLGGFLGRKGDGEPGTKSLWLGLQRLDDLSSMWKLMTTIPNYCPSSSPLVSSNPGYG